MFFVRKDCYCVMFWLIIKTKWQHFITLTLVLYFIRCLPINFWNQSISSSIFLYFSGVVISFFTENFHKLQHFLTCHHTQYNIYIILSIFLVMSISIKDKNMILKFKINFINTHKQLNVYFYEQYEQHKT